MTYTATKGEKWDTEDDLHIFSAHGFICYVLRHPSLKHYCGYVMLEKEHPCYGKDYDWKYGDIEIDVHGGLTHSEMRHGDKWTFGFDCAHLGDYTPGTDLDGTGDTQGEYKDLSYVKRHLTKLASQMRQIQDNQ